MTNRMPYLIRNSAKNLKYLAYHGDLFGLFENLWHFADPWVNFDNEFMNTTQR